MCSLLPRGLRKRWVRLIGVLFLEISRKHLGWYKWPEARKYFCFSELSVYQMFFSPIKRTLLIWMLWSFLKECLVIMDSVLRTFTSQSFSWAGQAVGESLNLTCLSSEQARFLLVKQLFNVSLRDTAQNTSTRALRRRAEMLSTEDGGMFLLLCSAKPPAFYKHIKH